MDIILITSSYPLHPDDSEAAAGLFVRDFAAELASQGHSIRLLTQDRPGRKEDEPSFRVVRYPWRGGKPLSNLKPTNPSDILSIISVMRNGYRALDTLIEEKRPDVILALWAVPAGLFARRAKRKHGIPYRVWTLGSDIWGYGKNPLTRPIVRYALKGAEKVFADGIKLAEETAVLYGSDVQFLPSSRRLPTGLPCPPELDNSFKNFLFIGRYHPNKGPDLLVEAVSLLEQSVRDQCRFHMFGGGPMKEQLETMISDLKLSDCVTLHGFADRSTAAAYLSHCHALVIPSRIESIPVIFSDATQLNCPILATSVGDLEKLLIKYGGGISVNPNPKELKDGIKKMIDEGEKSFRNGTENMSAIFDLESNAKAIITA